MTDSSRASSTPHSPGTAPKHPPGGRQRVISSCLTCRRRKVKCDHVHPICGACTRGNHVCTYASDQMLGSAVGSGGTRISKPAYAGNGRLSRNGDVQARLDRLESLLEKAVSGNPPPQQSLPRYTMKKSRGMTQSSRHQRQVRPHRELAYLQTTTTGHSFLTADKANLCHPCTMLFWLMR
jgi:hypothetical protein